MKANIIPIARTHARATQSTQTRISQSTNSAASAASGYPEERARACAHARECEHAILGSCTPETPLRGACEAAQIAYREAFGRDPSRWDCIDISYYAARMHRDMIPLAIRATLDAPRPTWTYAVAILSRCLREQCLTPDAFHARTAAHRAKRAQQAQTRRSAPLPAQQYTQREYTREELDQLFEPI